MDEADEGDRAAWPEERQARASADRSRTDAAHVLCPAMVRLARRGGGGVRSTIRRHCAI